MGVIDPDALVDALLSASEEGINLGLAEIQRRAQKHAPVRDVFRHGHGKTGGSRAARADEIAAIEKMVDRWGSKGPPTAYSARSANLRNFAMTSGGGLATHRGSELWKAGSIADQTWIPSDAGGHEPSPVSIRGRPNSYHPVIQSPIGRIGSRSMRSWAGDNLLEIGVIRGNGKEFLLSDLLSSRGRYEAFGRVGPGGKRAGRGRAVKTAGVEGEMVGGRLRDGITIIPAKRNGTMVYGFVQAVATDPGKKHNYAKDQEFGSRHNRAQPFLRPGLRESKDRIVKMIDPSKGAQKGLMQQRLQSGRRVSSGSEVGVPVRLRIKAQGWDGLANKFLSDLGLGR